jgi:uncharacterized SAM-binding protein YcdF (DUF218 family)
MEKNTKCIIILGGGIGKGGELPEWSQERCKSAVEYYFENKSRFDMVFIPTSGGTYHYPNQTDKLGFTIFECDLMTKFLLEHNIPEDKIFRDYSSFDTIGNAFFVKTLFTDIRKWDDLVVITSDFHMSRSIEIFNFIFCVLDKKYKIEYLNSKNNVLFNLNDRLCKEEKSRIIFKKNMKNINTIEQFHKWLYSTHECYKSNQKERKLPSKNLLYQ